MVFFVLMNVLGLKIFCCDYYGVDRNVFDYFFFSCFDEQDVFVIFDEVEVLKYCVFCDSNLIVFNSVMCNGWIGNIMQQMVVCVLVKFEFVYDLVNRIVNVIGQMECLEIIQMLGEFWLYVELIRVIFWVVEVGVYDYGDGIWFCDEVLFIVL